MTTVSVPEHLRELLTQTKARDVLPQKWELLSVLTTDTVGNAFAVPSRGRPLVRVQFSRTV